MNQEIMIEKDVPLPALKHGNAKYPFGSLVVGDSFQVPKDEKKHCRTAAYMWGKYNSTPEKGFKFFVGQCPRHADYWRCWRIA